ncbi:unnamed protein product [Arctia plantaginis]|uniref:Uncharacterized protein n=1 Tax=Arctia plantaginis TaxID=874455 RepID=A0A8S1ATA2_ARCPL|nr:unnamed protein product [Arctia plantaginis]CAB3253334.1 unnamed protein product [Arctia plantaginis]
MADSPEIEDTSNSNSLKISLPTVLCTTDSEEKTVKSIKTTFVSSESKLSLPSNLGTPTSPLNLSSPLSLPSSPCVKTSSQSSANSLPNPTPKPLPLNKQGENKTLINSGSATGK